VNEVQSRSVKGSGASASLFETTSTAARPKSGVRILCYLIWYVVPEFEEEWEAPTLNRGLIQSRPGFVLLDGLRESGVQRPFNLPPHFH